MNKLKQKKGFTLVEMLMCMLILILLSGICNIGMNLASDSYNASVFESESQMLSSSINTYLADILRYSTTVTTAGEEAGEASQEVIGFYSNSYSIQGGNIIVSARDYENSTGGRVQIKRTETDESPVLLVGESLYTDSMYVESFVLTYDATTGVFSGSYIIKSAVIEDAEKLCEFSYRRVYK